MKKRYNLWELCINDNWHVKGTLFYSETDIPINELKKEWPMWYFYETNQNLQKLNVTNKLES